MYMYIHHININMTKINKNFTLSIEIVEKLKENNINASELVEKLLQEHFKFSLEEKKNLIQSTAYQLKNYSKTAKILRKQMKLLSSFEKIGIDKYTLRWLLQFSEKPYTFEILEYKKQRDLDVPNYSDKCLKAWEIIQKDVDLFKKF